MLDKNKNKTLSNNTGFTLVELLASIFIIALISSVFIVNYNNTSKRSQLKMATQKLASDIRLAQNYSLGSKTYDGVNTPGGGWGVHFSSADPSDYIIFADINNNQTYDLSEAMEVKTFPAGVAIFSMTLSLQGKLDIVFFPPDPTIYFNGIDVFSGTITFANVTLTENISGSKTSVTVNSFGLIDAE